MSKKSVKVADYKAALPKHDRLVLTPNGPFIDDFMHEIDYQAIRVEVFGEIREIEISKAAEMIKSHIMDREIQPDDPGCPDLLCN